MSDAACDGGTFGIQCALECHCENDVNCNRFSGVCPRGQCAHGWLGTSCQTGQSINQSITVP